MVQFSPRYHFDLAQNWVKSPNCVLTDRNQNQSQKTLSTQTMTTRNLNQILCLDLVVQAHRTGLRHHIHIFIFDFLQHISI